MDQRLNGRERVALEIVCGFDDLGLTHAPTGSGLGGTFPSKFSLGNGVCLCLCWMQALHVRDGRLPQSKRLIPMGRRDPSEPVV
jgi:hypothetical protein